MLLLIVGVLVAAILALILYARWNFGVLERMGLPVDKPHFIFGNTYYTYKTPAGLLDIDLFKRLGPIYGVYEGRQPQIHICDAELIRLITTKDQEYFNDKRRVDFRDELLNEMQDFQPYDKWKILRTHLTPQFSSAKLKQMSVSMIQTIKEFTGKLKENVESSPGKKLVKYDLRDAIMITLTEMLARCFYSLKIVTDPNDLENQFVDLVRKLLEPVNIHSPFIDVLIYSFPFMAKFTPALFDRKRTIAIEHVFGQIIENRRKSGEKKNDALDFLIGEMDKVDTPEYKKANVTKQTIIAESFFILLGGQDQVSSTIGTMIYLLLQNPEMEEKIYKELDKVLAYHKGEISYEIISDLQYLTACLTETIRLFPFFNRTERVCTKNWKNEEFNLDIKKGTVIQFPLWAANRNPKYFDNAETFNPDRFLPGNKEKLHPYAMTSFGFGPRNCIGIKIAYEVLTLFSAIIFKNFKFHLREDSKPVYLAVNPVWTPHLPFYFDVTSRN